MGGLIRVLKLPVRKIRSIDGLYYSGDKSVSYAEYVVIVISTSQYPNTIVKNPKFSFCLYPLLKKGKRLGKRNINLQEQASGWCQHAEMEPIKQMTVCDNIKHAEQVSHWHSSQGNTIQKYKDYHSTVSFFQVPRELKHRHIVTLNIFFSSWVRISRTKRFKSASRRRTCKRFDL